MDYDLAYERATQCTQEQPGARALLGYLDEQWPHIWSKGIYVCRNIRGSTSSKSVHSEGRAIDVGVSETSHQGLRVGDEIAEWLIENAEAIGCQYFIWNRRSWRPDRGWRPYNGTSPHRDHLHVELTRRAAATLNLPYLRGLPGRAGLLRRVARRLIPRGPATRTGNVFPDAVDIDDVISWAIDPDEDACYLLTASGHVYAFPPSNYRGAPAHEVQGREFDMLGDPESIVIPDKPSGYLYEIITDLDYSYGY